MTGEVDSGSLASPKSSEKTAGLPENDDAECGTDDARHSWPWANTGTIVMAGALCLKTGHGSSLPLP